MDFDTMPTKVVAANTDGINNASDLFTSNTNDAADLARMLTEQPVAVIRRVLNMTCYHREGLGKIDENGVSELVRPVIDVVRTDDPTRLRGCG